jgi:hypothetical protein
MKPSFLPSALLVVLTAVSTAAPFCLAQASGQIQSEDVHGLRIRPTKETPMPTPFPLDARTGRAETLEFRAPEGMTAADRSLADSAQGEIERRAALQGFHLDEQPGSRAGGWGYEQAVCPAFPQHMVLEYSRLNGAGDVTLFSAVVPRGGEGHVRVIPVRRRGYSLFTPSSSNALTLNDFNHMVKEEPAGLSPDWLTSTLCYAALAGGHVRAALVAATPADERYPLLAPAKLAVSHKGGAEVYFVDAAAPAGRSEWVFHFAQNGHLLKVGRVGPHELFEKPVRGTATEVTGVPTKESVIDVGKPAN